MTLAIMGYFAISLGMLMALTRMIVLIGRGTECAQAGTAIATGYMAIGVGGVTLIAVLIPLLTVSTDSIYIGTVTLIAVGLASLTLGLGFTHAVRTLERIARPKAVRFNPEPVLG